MAYKIKFIKNPPRAEELISIYNSDLYKELLEEFGNNFKLAENVNDIQMIRQELQREYLILNISIEEVLTELQEFKDDFFSFCISRAKFYENYNDENPNDEFAEGEELDEEDEDDEDDEFMGFAKTCLWNNFCEFYLLKNGDKERTLHYLKTTGMPYAKRHLSEIMKIHKKTVANKA